MFSRFVTGVLLRRYNSNVTYEIRNAYVFTQHYGKMHGKFKFCSRKMSMWLREQSVQVVRACTRQFEFIAAQRIRRSIQIFHLYTRIWDEVALKEFIKSWKRRAARNTKDFLVGAVGVTVFNWEKEKIPDNEMYSYSKEIDGIHKLRDGTVICPECNLRLIVDAAQPNIQYCQCHKVKYAINRIKDEDIDWEPFIERQDMLVWRREEKETRGLYSYKVYGSFDDVSAEDFLQVQIDIDYRKEWDATAKQLEVIDTDQSSKDSTESCSDIIYWEMIWPRMFANRDYVYQRRWLYDKESDIVIIVSKGTDHPNAPNRPDTYRVTKYWSYMVIKPFTSFHEPGIEFGLTYFDDPGVNIPSAVTSWVAMSGLSDYLCRMRQAGKEYKSFKASQEQTCTLPKIITNIENQNNEDESSTNIEKENNLSNEDNKENDILNVTVSKDTNKDLESTILVKSISQESKKSLEENEKDKVEDNDEPESTQDDNQGFFDYFFLAKLFA